MKGQLLLIVQLLLMTCMSQSRHIRRYGEAFNLGIKPDDRLDLDQPLTGRAILVAACLSARLEGEPGTKEDDTEMLEEQLLHKLLRQHAKAKPDSADLIETAFRELCHTLFDTHPNVEASSK